MSAAPAPGIAHALGEALQTLDTRLLQAIHHGQVDVGALARRELASRGLDGDGRWVGFAAAERALGV